MTAEPSDRLLIGAAFGVFGGALALWAGGVTASIVTGHGLPHAQVAAGVLSLTRPLPVAWARPMPSPWLYWLITAVVLAAAVGAAYRARGTLCDGPSTDPPGLAGRVDIRAAAGQRALLGRAPVVRPQLTHPRPGDVGYRLGTCRGVPVWASIEDSMIVVGPPRSGKGLHVVIPMIRAAPGAVVTTSTRPDNLTATLPTRTQVGPVAIFDPQQLASGHSAALHWSPVHGCDLPQTAMIRARALASGSGRGVDNADFWQAQTEAVLRAFLHAAALDGRTARDLYRWSLQPALAADAVAILRQPGAADGWADALDAAAHADPRTRDSIWVGVRTALAPLADPRILAAVTPTAGHELDPTKFLAESGTLYLLGTATGAGAAAGLLTALIEDIAETARRRAAAFPGGRLDPPLALLLDEAANYPLPSLPALMSEGGGTGITTVTVLQSLAQARARWGEHDGAALWDSAIVKLILGGSSNTRDLTDLSKLIGDRDDNTISIGRDAQGRRTTTTSQRRIPILDIDQLRALPFGTALLLLRSAKPAKLRLDG